MIETTYTANCRSMMQVSAQFRLKLASVACFTSCCICARNLSFVSMYIYSKKWSPQNRYTAAFWTMVKEAQPVDNVTLSAIKNDATLIV